MKRTLLITGGIIIVLILVAIWAYILFTGTTSDTVSFSDFELGNTTDPTVMLPEEEDIPEETDEPADQAERLRQLTTTPVVGFAEVVSDTDSDPTVLYVEAGTGHIYAINLLTEESDRISATTIPLASNAALTPDGQHVLIQSDAGPRASFTVGTLSTSSDRLNNFTLDEAIVSFAATNENEFIFATQGVGELVVKKYDPTTGDITQLFTVPFVEASIAWHQTTAGPHVVYPKTTRSLEGYVYSYTNGQITRVNATGYGLSALGSDDFIIFSEVIDSRYTTFSIGAGELIPNQTPVTLMPEKCAFGQTNSSAMICGVDSLNPSPNTPDDWYRGTRTSNDLLWEYSFTRDLGRLIIAPEDATGRQVDIINPQFGPNDSNFFFQNKIDNTLWVYRNIINETTSN